MAASLLTLSVCGKAAHSVDFGIRVSFNGKPSLLMMQNTSTVGKLKEDLQTLHDISAEQQQLSLVSSTSSGSSVFLSDHETLAHYDIGNETTLYLTIGTNPGKVLDLFTSDGCRLIVSDKYLVHDLLGSAAASSSSTPTIYTVIRSTYNEQQVHSQVRARAASAGGDTVVESVLIVVAFCRLVQKRCLLQR